MTADNPEAVNDGLPRASLWTPRGRGAIATIRVQVDLRNWSAVNSLPFNAANGRPLAAQSFGRVLFGTWGADPVEQVVVCPIDQSTLEIHCHGGDAAAARILDDLARAGFVVLTWPEMLDCTAGLLEAELFEELSRATTLRTASLLLEQCGGLLRSSLKSLTADFDSFASRIDGLLHWADFGQHLTRPWKVVLAGRPNVGKSSLINALVGYTRSVVFDQPGTTRDIVTAVTAVDGWAIELSDTAGLRTSSEPLEAAGVARARSTLAQADLQIVLVDISTASSDEDRLLIADCPRAIVVAHKCDLKPFSGSGEWPVDGARTWLRVSSKTGEGVEDLIQAISTQLVSQLPPVGTPLPVTPRQISILRRAQQAGQRGDSSAIEECIRELLG